MLRFVRFRIASATIYCYDYYLRAQIFPVVNFNNDSFFARAVPRNTDRNCFKIYDMFCCLQDFHFANEFYGERAIWIRWISHVCHERLKFALVGEMHTLHTREMDDLLTAMHNFTIVRLENSHLQQDSGHLKSWTEFTQALWHEHGIVCSNYSRTSTDFTWNSQTIA